MQVVECWAFGPLTVEATYNDGLARLQLGAHGDLVVLCLSDAQMRQIETAIGGYLDTQAENEKATVAAVAG